MQNAPDFSLQDQHGKTHTLSEFAGKWVVLYFYPEDDTPGCTVEACSFRDARDEIVAQGAEVIGISKDSLSSHEDFVGKYKLNFTLLSDPNLEAIKAYGVWGKKMFGHEGVRRQTFIINPEGKIVKKFGRVTPLGHGEQMIKALKELQAS